MEKFYVSSGQATLSAYALGSGWPLLLIHGTSNDASRWFPLMEALGSEFRTIAYDRRGRGGGTEPNSYSFSREVEDVIAVAQAAEQPLTVLGHSFGALCVLAAIPELDPRSSAILYEPPTTGRPQSPPAVVAQLVELLERGRREEAIEVLFSQHLEVPAGAIAGMRAKPSWQTKVALAHTVPRELTAAAAFEVDETRYRGVEIEALLLEGSASPALARAGVAYAGGLLRRSTIVTMAGQGHLAMDTAPAEFARRVRDFVLRQSDARRAVRVGGTV